MKKIKVGSYSSTKQKINLKERPERKPVVNRRLEIAKERSKTGKKRKIFTKKFFMIILLVGLFSFLGYGYYRIQVLSSRVENYNEDGKKIECKNILNPSCWTDAFKPQLKQTNGKTNMLIIGLDTRENTGSLKNTDSIIIASFDHTTQRTALISIPRDFYVHEYGNRINTVYAFTYKKNPDDEYQYLKEMVGKVIGTPIHYLATIKFSGVIDGINKLGGVEICPESYVQAQYPNDYPKPGESHWLYYDFPAECQTVDGEKALVYARFRHVSKGSLAYASDFSRARRQQEVIESLKDKALAQDLSISQRAENYWEILQTLNKSITVDISLEDILAGLSFLDSADRDPINIVLDPSFGGLNNFIYTDTSSGAYLIKPKDPSYVAIQNEIATILDNAVFYREQPNITVRNQSGVTLANDHITYKMRDDVDYYYRYSFINDAKTDKLYGIKVFDLSNGAKPESLKFILEYLGLEAAETAPLSDFGLSQSSNKEDILIVVGPAEPPPTATVIPSN